MDGESSKRIKLESILHDQRLNLNLYSLSLKDLREITNDFSDERLLGQGGFGRVYKGLLPNGDIIAVKKLTSTMSGLQDKQYENEVRNLMRLIHPNVVQLVGYCSETEEKLVLHNGKYVYAEKSERLLCLEYLRKGSLCNHVSDASSGLDWDTRYKIIEGICNGLHYLHEEWQPSTPIIHRDLKPANILLDDNMVPKIADFGLSRLFGEDQTRTITKTFGGTLGYMAPEYLNRGIITKELDIFSLGVIIIQVVTGDKLYPYKDEASSSHEFIELVVKKWRNRLGKEPGYTSQEFDCGQIRRCVEIGLLCVKFDRAERPTTRRIIEMLLEYRIERELQCRLQVQRQLQLRIEAQGKYLQRIVEEQEHINGAGASRAMSSEQCPIPRELTNPSTPVPTSEFESSTSSEFHQCQVNSARFREQEHINGAGASRAMSSEQCPIPRELTNPSTPVPTSEFESSTSSEFHQCPMPYTRH